MRLASTRICACLIPFNSGPPFSRNGPRFATRTASLLDNQPSERCGRRRSPGARMISPLRRAVGANLAPTPLFLNSCVPSRKQCWFVWPVRVSQDLPTALRATYAELKRLLKAAAVASMKGGCRHRSKQWKNGRTPFGELTNGDLRHQPLEARIAPGSQLQPPFQAIASPTRPATVSTRWGTSTDPGS
jgi:hypothetical protein